MGKYRMTKKEAVAQFKADLEESEMNKTDSVAIRCAWHDWTDYLHKDGQITYSQYQNWRNPYETGKY